MLHKLMHLYFANKMVIIIIRASLVAQMVKNLPAKQEIWIQSLGWEDPLEKEMTTPSSILAWRITWTEEPDQLQSKGSQKSWTQLSNWRATIYLCPEKKTLIFSQLPYTILRALGFIPSCYPTEATQLPTLPAHCTCLVMRLSELNKNIWLA